MTNHEINKPTSLLVMQHLTVNLLRAVKQEMDKVFANGLNIFSTSSPGAIPAGTDG